MSTVQLRDTGGNVVVIGNGTIHTQDDPQAQKAWRKRMKDAWRRTLAQGRLAKLKLPP